MSTLRAKLIRLAHENEALRPHLLPILAGKSPFFMTPEELAEHRRNQKDKGKPYNPWTAKPGEKRPEEPEKGSYEAYVKRKKEKGEKPLSKDDWARVIRQHRFPID